MNLSQDQKNVLTYILEIINRHPGISVMQATRVRPNSEDITYFKDIPPEGSDERIEYFKDVQKQLLSLQLVELGEMNSGSRYNRLFLTKSGGEVAVGAKSIDDIVKELEREAKKADLDFEISLRESQAFILNKRIAIAGLIISIVALLVSIFKD